jgi:ribosomal protein L1
MELPLGKEHFEKKNLERNYSAANSLLPDRKAKNTQSPHKAEINTTMTIATYTDILPPSARGLV